MAAISDYALLGDTRGSALVSISGSIDWLCLPRFDSDACFAAILGGPDQGRWLIAPEGEASVSRTYLADTMVLETRFEVATGAVSVTDFLTTRDGPCLIRLVRGISGTVRMRSDITVRFGNGAVVPASHGVDAGVVAIAGPDATVLHADVPHRSVEGEVAGAFEVRAGEEFAFSLQHFPSHLQPPPRPDAQSELQVTTAWWRDWLASGTGLRSGRAEWDEAVDRSLLTLKALTYGPTGGIVAAPTTSLPEQIGGSRNWDYRYVWLRDATFTLYAFLLNDHHDEARAWREWLLRATAGRPEDLQTLYGVAGERRVPEYEADWLPGFAGSAPVRIGNAASKQLQLDVYGEVMDVLHLTRRGHDGAPDLNAEAWQLQRGLMEFLESSWDQPDNGIWEIRGPRRHFTHSRVSCWMAFDRAVKAVEWFGLDGPVDRWRRLRDDIHAEVCADSWNSDRGAFVQYPGSSQLDSSLLLMPLVGFLPADDPRMLATVRAIEQELAVDGLLLRYQPDEELEGVAGDEGAFLLCSFWLADNYAMSGRTEDAERLFERLLALRNDVGLLAEEYDPRNGMALGNMPQAFSHVGLINTARNLVHAEAPAQHRSSHSPGSSP